MQDREVIAEFAELEMDPRGFYREYAGDMHGVLPPEGHRPGFATERGDAPSVLEAKAVPVAIRPADDGGLLAAFRRCISTTGAPAP